MKKVMMKVNGRSHQFVVEPDRVLLDVLREDLGLTGAKQSCDRKGQCGACTVIVNGKAVRSCLQKMTNLDGAEVITIEGLGTPDNPHLIQEAYVLSGAIQCGFCTPGMILATKALLDRNPNPDDRRDQEGPGAQPLPVHGLYEDHRCGEARRPVSSGAKPRRRGEARPQRPEDRRLPSPSVGHDQGLRNRGVLGRHQAAECPGAGGDPQHASGTPRSSRSIRRRPRRCLVSLAS